MAGLAALSSSARNRASSRCQRADGAQALCPEKRSVSCGLESFTDYQPATRIDSAVCVEHGTSPSTRSGRSSMCFWAIRLRQLNVKLLMLRVLWIASNDASFEGFSVQSASINVLFDKATQ